MVRIHARQRVLHQELTPFIENALISILATFLALFFKFADRVPQVQLG